MPSPLVIQNISSFLMVIIRKAPAYSQNLDFRSYAPFPFHSVLQTFAVTDTFKATYVLLCNTLIQFGNVAGFYLFTQVFILLQSLFSFSAISKGWKW